jgi:M6 family metalloprotease-like protein
LLDAAADWYRSVSYGRLEFRAETLHRWLRLPESSAEYAADPARYLADSVAAADPYVDFSQVDVVYLVPAARTPVATPVSAILNSFGVRADGKEIGAWVPFDPGFADGTAPSVLLHETGHLLGLPDLYVAGARSTFHLWDLMTGGGRWPAELLAWHRWKLGWIGDSQIACVAGRANRVVTLTPLERPGGLKAVFIRRGNRVLALEARARLGYDSTRCDTGVLAYVVDQAPFKRAPIQIVATDSDSRPPTTNCGPRWNAPFDIGRGEARSLQLSTWNFRLRLLAKLPDGSYRVRVTSQ